VDGFEHEKVDRETRRYRDGTRPQERVKWLGKRNADALSSSRNAVTQESQVAASPAQALFQKASDGAKRTR